MQKESDNAMTDKECLETYQRLVDILNQNRLAWVVAQVEEQIRLGKTTEKEIDTLKEGRGEFELFTIEDYPSRLRKGPKATFPVTVDYQPPERLALLLDAVERVIVNTVDMENHLIEYFGKEVDNWIGVEFYSETPNSVPNRIGKETVVSRLENGRQLKHLLDAMRKEIEQ